MPETVGDARVSTKNQNVAAQRDRFIAEAGVIRVFEDAISGELFDGPFWLRWWNTCAPATQSASCGWIVSDDPCES